ncbi:hypothetical protein EDD21DRAFT_381492 [Dissophora ornata]|nr:hypothetical protein EDD21DRAFT_381492 [Dissophora ornata]
MADPDLAPKQPTQKKRQKPTREEHLARIKREREEKEQALLRQLQLVNLEHLLLPNRRKPRAPKPPPKKRPGRQKKLTPIDVALIEHPAPVPPLSDGEDLDESLEAPDPPGGPEQDQRAGDLVQGQDDQGVAANDDHAYIREFDSAARKIYQPVKLTRIFGKELKNWTPRSTTHLQYMTQMGLLRGRDRQRLEDKVIRQTFYNTVAPIRGALQRTPRSNRSEAQMRELRKSAPANEDAHEVVERKISQRNQEEGEELFEIDGGADGDVGYGDSPLEPVLQSKKCTACILQGLDCSGHKPICSQCYYSSARTTSSLSGSGAALLPPPLSSSSSSPSLSASTPSQSTCSYAVEGTPLVPAHIFRMLKHKVQGHLFDFNSDDSDDSSGGSSDGEAKGNFRVTPQRLKKAVEELTVVKDRKHEAGWTIGHPGIPIVDQNPAAGVDFLIRSNHTAKRDYMARPMRHIFREKIAEIQEREERERELGHPLGEEGSGAAAAMGSSSQAQVMANSSARAEEEAEEDEDQVVQRMIRSGIKSHVFVGSEIVQIPVAEGKDTGRDGASDEEGGVHRQGENRTDDIFLALNRSRNVPKEDTIRADTELNLKLNRDLYWKTKQMEAMGSLWTVGSLTAAFDDGTTDTAMAGDENETPLTNVRRERPKINRPLGMQMLMKSDNVVEVDVGGQKIKRAIRRNTVARRKKRDALPRRSNQVDATAKVEKVKKRRGRPEPVDPTVFRIPKYRKRMGRTFRPWVARTHEKVIPSACDLPETSFLESLHYYASYFYTHVNPCPDVFESMDLTSHIALGMIIQEVISDFAFKLGKESQLEDIEVKQAKLDFSKNLQEWEGVLHGTLPSRQGEVDALQEEVRRRKRMTRKRKSRSLDGVKVNHDEEDEDEGDEEEQVLWEDPSTGEKVRMEGWVERRMKRQRREEQEYVERLRKEWSHYDDFDEVFYGAKDKGEGDKTTGTGRRINTSRGEADAHYWEELQYLAQSRINPAAFAIPKRVLVNGYDSDVKYDSDNSNMDVDMERRERDDSDMDRKAEVDGLEENEDRDGGLSSDLDYDSDDEDVRDKRQQKLPSQLPTQSESQLLSQLHGLPAFTFESDEGEYMSDNESLASVVDEGDDEEEEQQGHETRNGSENSLEESDKEPEATSDLDEDVAQGQNVDDEESGPEDAKGKGRDSDTSVDSDVDMDELPMPANHKASRDARQEAMDDDTGVLRQGVFDFVEKGSEDEIEDSEEELPEPEVVSVNNTRLGRMFGGPSFNDDEDEDEDEDSDQGGGVISQVVLDDSSSEDGGNYVGLSESEDED